MKKQIVQGSLLVALGAACYGLLATYVKLAYSDGFNIAEITVSQFVIGMIGLLILNLLVKKKDETTIKKSNKSNIFKLILAGTSLGLTSTFYYLAVQLIPVSIGIVLLMQTVWMGVVLDIILTKKMPSFGKIIAVILILFGTILATNMLFDVQKINFIGIGWGLLAAVSYTISVYTSGKIAVGMHAFRRTIWMLLGGLIIVVLISFPTIIEKFNWQIFTSWGIVLALFGTILPPVLFSIGMPKINLGLGAILSSVEIPVSVLMAYFLLHEKVNIYQWSGIVLIMLTVIVMNLPKKEQD
jgi:drug/metabolite transporter (DMT)-like permease